MATLSEFAKRIRAIGDSVPAGANKAKIAVAVAIDQAVVLATPVGDPNLWQHKGPPGYVGGRARANWQVGIGNAPVGEVDSTNWQATSGQSKAAIGRAKPGEPVHLTNNLPYIVPLNQGHSRQAPAGFVEQAIQVGEAEAARVKVLEP